MTYGFSKSKRLWDAASSTASPKWIVLFALVLRISTLVIESWIAIGDPYWAYITKESLLSPRGG